MAGGFLRILVVAASAAVVLAALSAGVPADHPKDKMEGASLFPAADIKWQEGPPSLATPGKRASIRRPVAAASRARSTGRSSNQTLPRRV